MKDKPRKVKLVFTKVHPDSYSTEIYPAVRTWAKLYDAETLQEIGKELYARTLLYHVYNGHYELVEVIGGVVNEQTKCFEAPELYELEAQNSLL